MTNKTIVVPDNDAIEIVPVVDNKMWFHFREEMIDLAKKSVASLHSQRVYSIAVRDFFDWYEDPELGNFQPMRKSLINEYKDYLVKKGLKAKSVNLKLSAIRKMIREAVDNGYLDADSAESVLKAENATSSGETTGNWLSLKDARKLINDQDITTLRGKRDRAILSVMIGCGLRRSEVAALTFADIKKLDGRWVLVDIVGKGSRKRTVPIPEWAKKDIDEWAKAAKIKNGRLFRWILKSDVMQPDEQLSKSITDQAIRNIVKRCSLESGLPVAAHDLRRTYAKLAYAGGADLKQIQISLGHASVRTTEIYLGTEQTLNNAPCDYINM